MPIPFKYIIILLFLAGGKGLAQTGILAKGMAAPPLLLEDRNGGLLPLDSVKGKLILVDFWGSWCGACRQEHAKFKKLVEAMPLTELAIISVSADRNPEKWKQAIEDQQLNWLHGKPQQGMEMAVMREWQVPWFPYNYLLNDKREIIGKNVSYGVLKAWMESVSRPGR